MGQTLNNGKTNSLEISDLEKIVGQDKTAFEKLMSHYHCTVYRLCYRLLRDTCAAEDATQETFLRAFLKIDSYDPSRRFSSWLYAIAHHYCLDQLKRVRPHLITWDEAPTWAQALDQKTGQPEKSLLQSETASEVQTWVSTLPAHERTPIILKYWQQYSCQEIAQKLNTSPSAIKSKLFRARKKMARVALPSMPTDTSCRLHTTQARPV